ncbi:MAG: multiheme c-type cytochrome [Gemmataceae bacterium]
MKKQAVGVLLLICVASCGRQGSVPPPEDRPIPKPEPPSYALGVTGTASCAGATCHGRVEPVAGRDFLLTEHTTWVLRDRHADAYRVLFDERSVRIARNLGPEPAHESARCLACHANPRTALAKDDPLAKADRSFGVGCESCHGGAAQWLKAHDKPEWDKLTPEEKQAKGMVSLVDLPARVQVCAGCHVGAGPDPENKIPARDVNHDLIAAGHPRLNFEFAAYSMNMPIHWKAPARRNEAEYWALGQIATMKSALDLLAYRVAGEPTSARPWPEFAEYNCFACHHDLDIQSFRQARGYGKNLPGSIPPAEWYTGMPRLLADLQQGGDPGLGRSLDALERLLRTPYPNREQVASQAKSCAALTANWLKVYRTPAANLLRPALAASAPTRHWDHATQLYLGFAALADADNAQQTAALKELYEQLSFPVLRAGRLDSPRGFDPDKLDSLFKKLGQP